MDDVRPTLGVKRLEALSDQDLSDLCEATEGAILDGGGFGWVKPPPRDTLERYWRGVLLVPERELHVALLGGTICGSGQLYRNPKNNEAQGFACQLTSAFVAPWARGHGLARMLTESIEASACAKGFRLLNLDVRDTQCAAIALYESMGFVRWGHHPHYAMVDGSEIGGRYYYKLLDQPPK